MQEALLSNYRLVTRNEFYTFEETKVTFRDIWFQMERNLR